MSQLATVLMQYIDASMVGRLGATQSASIGLVSTTTWLFGSVCNAATIGFSVQVAQLIGAKRYEEAKNVFRQALVTVLILGALVVSVGIGISGSLPRWLGGHQELWRDATRYFAVYVAFLPLSGLNMLGSSMLQCSGNMRVPSRLNMMMCGLDVVFNWFFIFGLNMGVLGAALGTGVAELITACLMLYFAAVKSPELHLGLHGSFRLTKEVESRAFQIAWPVAFEHIVVCCAQIASTKIIAPLGTVALAANSFAITVESLCYMPGYGIGNAATTLIGQSIGAKRKELVAHFSRMTIGVGMAIMTLTGALMFAFAPQLIGIITPDPQVRELGAFVLRIEAFAEPMYAASIVASGALRGAGDTFIPSLLNFFSLWAVRIPLAYVLSSRMGLAGAWVAMSIELVFRGIVMLIRTRTVLMKKE